MCFHNYTQHNGCGHIGESYRHPWTLCDKALDKLQKYRGVNSPPLSPGVASFAAPPKRSSSTRRFFSLSGQLSRASTNASTASSRRAISGPTGAPKRSDSTSSGGSYEQQNNNTTATALDYSKLPSHQLLAVKCAEPKKSTYVTRDMDVCKECKRCLEEMRHMLERYDKSGSVRGTAGFERFLKYEGEGGGEREGDLTVPLDDGDEGGNVFGARQAIILGHPESTLNKEGPRGLGTMADEERYFGKDAFEKF